MQVKTRNPPSRETIDARIESETEFLSAPLRTTWETYKIVPYLSLIERYGLAEQVWVVARRGAELLYFEDIDDGFNFSPAGPAGEVLEHWCNDDPLAVALAKWTPDATYWGGRLGPAVPIPRFKGGKE